MIDNSVDTVAIDEAQFFSIDSQTSIVDVVQKLADNGHDVIIAGLDMTSDRKPFGPMPFLMSIAHEVHKLKAVCEHCGSEEAMYSFANFDKKSDIAIGNTEYNAICPSCYIKSKKK
jgi:thymidine kinase